MWSQARKDIEATFTDVIKLLENKVEYNHIGEAQVSQEEKWEYFATVQYTPFLLEQTQAGISNPQQIRVSIPKNTELDLTKTYMLKIVSANLLFNPLEKWRVESITEGQLSIVLIAEREVVA